MNNYEILKNKVYAGLEKRYGEITKEIQERTDYELGVIHDMGFDDYFLILDRVRNTCIDKEYIKDFCKRKGFKVPKTEYINMSIFGRGSGIGTMIAYGLNLSCIDPIKYDLYFDRFLNKERVSMPDFDYDVSRKDRQLLIEVLNELFPYVANIGTTGTMGVKGCIKDIGKVLGVPFQYTNSVAKKLSDTDGYEDFLNNESVMSEFLNIPNVDHDFYLKAIQRINGLGKSNGIHAGGIVLCGEDISSYIPCRFDGERLITEVDMHFVEDVGFVKNDFLGLKTLDVLSECEMVTGVSCFDITQNFDDVDVYYDLRNGKTLGVFQFEGDGTTKLLKDFNVSNFEDLALCNALYRPSGLDNVFDGKTMLQHAIDRKNKKEAIIYLFPEEEQYLSYTYGLMVYQEQIMRRVQQMTGCSLGKADIFRRAVGKKDEKLLAEQLDWFVDKAMNYRFTNSSSWDNETWRKQIVLQVMEDIKACGRYCFSGKEKITYTENGRYQPTIGEMYLIKTSKEFAEATGHLSLHKKYNRYGYPVTLSMTSDGRLVKNKITKITPTGINKTYTLKTETGKKITLTENHYCYTDKGKVQVKDIMVGDKLPCKDDRYKINRKEEYNFTNGNFEYNYPNKGECGFRCNPNGESMKFFNYREKLRKENAPCEICGNNAIRRELHHKDGNRKNNNVDNLQYLCNSCHKKEHYKNHNRVKKSENGYVVNWEKIVSITENEPELTFDVSVSGCVSYNVHENGIDKKYFDTNDIVHTVTNNDGICVSNCFNKSHACGYSAIGYCCAYYAHYYPEVFYSAMLNYEDNKDGLTMELAKLKTMGFTISSPNVNKSELDFTPLGHHTIAFGLASIKNMGKSAEAILEDREKRGEYSSLYDFSFRLKPSECDKSTLVSLAKAGAFDTICSMDRCSLVASMDNFCKMRTNRMKVFHRKAGDYRATYEELIDMVNRNDKKIKYEEVYDEDTATKRAYFENEVLGYFLSCTPLDDYKQEMEYYNCAIVEPDHIPPEAYYVGIISSVREITIKNGRSAGKKMCFLTLATDGYSYDVTCFNGIYESDYEHITQGNVVVVRGKRNEYNGKVSIVAEYVRTVDIKGVRLIDELHLYLNIPLNPLQLNALKSGLRVSGVGSTRLLLHIPVGNNDISVYVGEIIVNNYTLKLMSKIGKIFYGELNS